MVSKQLALVLVLFTCSVATVDNLYRYKNEAGGTVADWHVPAKFAGRGYEVLNPLGEVIKVVPRQLSDSELNDKDLVERLKRGAEAERARLAEWERFFVALQHHRRHRCGSRPRSISAAAGRGCVAEIAQSRPFTA